jgi:hypothetical protein
MGNGPAANSLGPFEDCDRSAPARDHSRRGESREPTTDNDEIPPAGNIFARVHDGLLPFGNSLTNRDD